MDTLPLTPMDTLPTLTPMGLTLTPTVLGTLARDLLMLSLRLMLLFCTPTMDTLLPLTPMVLTLTLMVPGTLVRDLLMLSLRLMLLSCMETMDMLDMLPLTPMDTLDTVPTMLTPTPMVPTPTWDKKFLLHFQSTKYPSATKNQKKSKHMIVIFDLKIFLTTSDQGSSAT